MRMTVGKKLSLSFGIMLAVVVMIGGIAYFGLERLNDAHNGVSARADNAVTARQVPYWQVNRYQAQANLVINRDLKAVAEFENAAKKMEELHGQLREAVDTPEERQWLADLDKADASVNAIFRDMVVPEVKHGMENVIGKYDAETDSLMAKAQGGIDKLAGLLKAQLDKAMADSQAEEVAGHLSQMLAVQETNLWMSRCYKAQADLVINRSLDCIKEFNENYQKLQECLAKVAKAADTPEEKAQVETIAQSCEGFSKVFTDQMVPEVKRLIEDRINQYDVKTDESAAIVEGMANKIADSLVAEEHSEEARFAATKAATTWLVIGLSVGCLVLGCFISLITTRLITRPIRATTAMLKDIATGDGDLTKRLEIKSKDEIGEMAGWFNQFVQQLHDMIGKIAGMADDVAAASTEISSSSEQMAAGAQTQSSQTTEVATAIEQMSATVLEVAKNATTAAETAKGSLTAAQQGGQVVQQTVDGMGSISVSTDQASHTIEDLGKASEEIGRIIGVINDIADQTNLLALNAAIEAARAGEHGRGFAVVADEVRKLAERTAEATKEVGATIHGIQEKTTTAVSAMDDGTQKVQAGLQLANQAGTSLQSIVANANDISGLIQQIAAAAEQQSAASEQISRNVESITSVTRQNASAIQQSAAASQQLARRAEELQGVCGRFKLDRSAMAKTA